MIRQDVEVICYFEGIKLPVTNIQVVGVAGLPFTYDIGLPPKNEVGNIEEGTQIEAFYYDKDSEVWRFFFRAVAMGTKYRKINGQQRRSVTALAPQSYMNSLPNKYLRMLDNDQLEGEMSDVEFLRLPWKKVWKLHVAQYLVYNPQVIDYYVVLNTETDSEKSLDEKIGIIEYFKNFLRMISDNWEPFYNNLNSRLEISDNHVYINERLFQRWSQAETITQFLQNSNSEIVSSGSQTVLDSILKFIEFVGYVYITPLCAAYKTKKLEETKSAEQADGEIRLEHGSKILAEYNVLGNLMNLRPPQCNYIEAGKNSTLDTFMVRPRLTRMMIDYSDEELSLKYAYAPKEIRDKNTGLDQVALSEYEIKSGIRPLIQNRRYMYYALMAKELKKNVDDDSFYEFFNRSAEYEYAKKKYQNNQVQITVSGFMPDIVAGLPGLIRDAEAQTYFYGMVENFSINIDIVNGSSNTSLKLTKAYEIDSFKDLESPNPFLLDEFTDDLQKYYDTMFLSDNKPEESLEFDDKDEENLRVKRVQKEADRDGHKVRENIAEYENGVRPGATMGEYLMSRDIPVRGENAYEKKYVRPPEDLLDFTDNKGDWILKKEDNAKYIWPDGQEYDPTKGDVEQPKPDPTIYKNKAGDGYKGNIYMEYLRENVKALKASYDNNTIL